MISSVAEQAPAERKVIGSTPVSSSKLQSHNSSVEERQPHDLKVPGSIPVYGKIPCSLMVRIAGFHPADPGSIPGMEAKRI